MDDFFDGVDDALATQPSPGTPDTASLLALARELVQALEPEALLPAVADAICRVVGGERVLLLTQEAPGHYRQTMLRRADGSDLPMPARFCMAACDESCQRGEVVFSYLPRKDSRWARDAQVEELGLIGFCAVPVRPERGPPLVVYADGHQSFAAGLSQQAREVLTLLASHAALAIDNAQALSEAAVDPQTHVHQPAFFARRLNEECGRSVRYRRNLSLALVSVDRAEELWRELGEGSVAIAEALGARVQKSVRQADLVGAAGPASFCVLMPETPVGERYDPTSLQTFVARLHADVAEHPFFSANRPVALAVRVAVVSHMHPSELSAEAFRRDVEDTLKQATARGEDLFVCR